MSRFFELLIEENIYLFVYKIAVFFVELQRLGEVNLGLVGRKVDPSLVGVVCPP